jgi:hypothetical protein
VYYGRTSLGGRIWYETSVPVFLEKFVLPLLAAAFIGVILLNPFKLDWQQQLSLAIAVVALAYFFAHSVHKTNRIQLPAPVGQPQANTPTEPPSCPPGTASSTGPATAVGSGNIANSGNCNTINGEPQASKDKKK